MTNPLRNALSLVLPTLSERQMTLLSCLYHTDGELWLGGRDNFTADRLVALGLAARHEARWHVVTPLGEVVFVRLLAQEDTPQGAAARRQLERAAA